MEKVVAGMNETDPIAILLLAKKVLEGLATTDASPADKIAALRVAASALEQANLAQQSATAIASIVANARGK